MHWASSVQIKCKGEKGASSLCDFPLLFSGECLNFGIKTLEEIKSKKMKEKSKKQGGKLSVLTRSLNVAREE